MTTKNETKQPTPEVFEQAPDARGRVRLDRPLTSGEAAKQDAENRERYEQERRKRFRGRG